MQTCSILRQKMLLMQGQGQMANDIQQDHD